MVNKIQTMDGNEAAAYVSYAFTEVAAIYPITPSSTMAEHVDLWAAHQRKNIFNQTVKVVEMQSEAGAAGAVHGSLQSGALTTTYTASQGLLLMIPNMYKMAGEFLPAVFHVSARALATHALSIFGDHQDVMATRQTGFALLGSTNVQETMDMAAIAHLAAIKARVPFLHFFDGFRTSHEVQRIETLAYEDLASLVDQKAIQEFRQRALSPEHPVTRGTAQNPDIYFQGREAGNNLYQIVPSIVEDYMEKLAQVCGRKYNLFDYYGATDATEVIVAMGSVCDTVCEVVDYLNHSGHKVGLVKVRLYRPFSEEHFLAAFPPTVKNIAVLDRTKEPGSIGEPLYLDVVKAFKNQTEAPLIIGGRFGLGSKDTRPSQILAVYKNLWDKNPKDRFTIGIVDDLTNTSLPDPGVIDTTATGTVSCKFWGLGSDGTVGACTTAVKIIGDQAGQNAQAYFSYDSKKSGGTTVSHLRFGKNPIKSSYLIYNADYIACHNQAFLWSHDLVKGLKPKGTFVLNCHFEIDELEEKLPGELRKFIADNQIEFYIIDAVSIAQKIGLGGRINMIMLTAFFKLAQIIPLNQAVDLLKQSIVKSYGNKGQKIVDMNHAAVDQALEALVKVDVPDSWKNAPSDLEMVSDVPDFVKNIQFPMARHEGDELPVSAFLGMEDGTFPTGTTAYEKRGIAVKTPEWQPDNCIQCNQCSYVCPHAVIRPFLLDGIEAPNAPAGFVTLPGKGKGLDQFQYRIQVSPLDCTGCGNCADVCPAPEKALVMKPAEVQIEAQADNWEFALTIKPKIDLIETNTLKGSQFIPPLFEFNGACPGCGETPYIKLITQLYGERMMVANATGCSSIYGGSAPSFPYTVNEQGQGPAWANSLFEDNAEFGYGMHLGVQQQREKLVDLVKIALTREIIPELKKALSQWLDDYQDPTKSKAAAKVILPLLDRINVDEDPVLKGINGLKEFFSKRSIWIIGGDGWAYDIGYGGLDHVLATGDDVNLLVMDTEVYSNTGGQSSKATQTAAIAKFAASGKRIRKKDLGMMAISYGYVYVAQIAMGANMNHTIRTIREAESYPGPSLIIAYSPCINHGIRTGMGTSIAQEKKAVEAGYWHLYRYNPLMKQEGKNPFTLDSKEPQASFKDFLMSEVRYSALANTFPEKADELFGLAEEHATERYLNYKRFSEMQY